MKPEFYSLEMMLAGFCRPDAQTHGGMVNMGGSPAADRRGSGQGG